MKEAEVLERLADRFTRRLLPDDGDFIVVYNHESLSMRTLYERETFDEMLSVIKALALDAAGKEAPPNP